MIRLIALLVAVLTLASGLAWLADRPGAMVITWEGYEVETSVFRAVVILGLTIGLCLFVWSLGRQLWQGPAILGSLVSRRRHRRGLEALSQGMIALGAGDRVTATRAAIQARKALPNEPLTHLLRAQAARLSGDSATSRRIFEAMLASPDTEQLGLRGLFLEAEAEGESEAARQFAERALAVNPKLPWPAEALFDLQCKAHDWAGALLTLAAARKHGLVDKPTGDRRRALLLTAQAQALEDADPEKSLSLALEAHGLARDLVPAAAIAGRLLASRGNTPRATKVIQETWKISPHPDLATAYAYARIGDSPRDRLQRVKQLAMLFPASGESAVAVATAAIEAREWGEARAALEGLAEDRLTQRVCTLMARIEGGEHADKGRVREWLARAVNAPRDPAWTADGIVSDVWQPVSPVTGMLDAFKWRVPVASLEPREGALLAAKMEELVALGAPVPVASAPVEIVPPTDSAAPRPAAPAPRAPAAEAEVEVVSAPEPRPTEATAATPGSATTAGAATRTVHADESNGAASSTGAETATPARTGRSAPARETPVAKSTEPIGKSEAPASAAAPARSSPPAPDAPATATVVAPRTAEPPPGKAPARPTSGAAPAAADTAAAAPTEDAGSGKIGAMGARRPVPSREPAAAAAPAGAKTAPATMRETASREPTPAPTAQSAAGQATPRPATAGAVSETNASATRGKAASSAGETRIFVPPRAPDDPGPSTAGEGDAAPGSAPARYRTTA